MPKNAKKQHKKQHSSNNSSARKHSGNKASVKASEVRAEEVKAAKTKPDAAKPQETKAPVKKQAKKAPAETPGERVQVNYAEYQPVIKTADMIGKKKYRSAGSKKITKERVEKFIFGTREKQGTGKLIVIYGLLICIGFVYLYPILNMVSTGFMDQNDLLDTSVKWIPSHLYMQNFKDAAKSLDFWRSFGKGLLIAGIPTVCNILIDMTVGYGFARYDFKGKKLMLLLLIFSYILPKQVTMIPTYVLYNDMKILGTIWTFILPALFGNGLNAPIFILIFYQFFLKVPNVLMEAAEIDGAGHFRRYFRIAVPSAIPAIVTVALFSFVWYWNEAYLTELYVRGVASKSIWTNLVVQLKNFDTSFSSRATVGDTATSLNESVRMAATTLSILPLLVMYIILQRQFVESIDRAGITGE